MLVLTRKIQEQIRIGDNITISVLKVKGNSVRIGIDAPREIRVVRGELPALESDTDPADTEPAATQSLGDDQTAVADLKAFAMQRLMNRRSRRDKRLTRHCASLPAAVAAASLESRQHGC